MNIGKPVADFSLPSTGTKTFSLSAARGTLLVPYFYPKSNTAGRAERTGRTSARGRRGVMVPGHIQEVLNFVKAL